MMMLYGTPLVYSFFFFDSKSGFARKNFLRNTQCSIVHKCVSTKLILSVISGFRHRTALRVFLVSLVLAYR